MTERAIRSLYRKEKYYCALSFSDLKFVEKYVLLSRSHSVTGNNKSVMKVQREGIAKACEDIQGGGQKGVCTVNR